MRVLLLILLLAFALPSHAASTPTLRVWTANEHGVVDLLPGGRVSMVIELRSDARFTAFAQHLTPEGLALESATASAGAIVTDPFVSWTGVVSRTQPINLVLVYRVLQNARAGDRALAAQAQVGRVQVTASRSIRVCCGKAQPVRWRLYLGVIRR